MKKKEVKTILFLPLSVLLLVSVFGCDSGSDQAVEQQMRAERAAQAAAEARRIEGEKQADRERQALEVRPEDESRKAFLAVVLAIGAGCLAAAVILWAALERRAKKALVSVLQHLHRRKEG